MKVVKYEKHQREYTIVGSGVIWAAILGKKVFDFFGGEISEIISVVKNGVYHHLQIEGERQAMSMCFIQRLNKGEIDLEKEYVKFDKKVGEYENFISKPENNFKLSDILKLFNYYEDLAPVALASFDPIEMIDELDESKREKFLEWTKKTRRKEEMIYKNGEIKFIPKYLEWFRKEYVPSYEVDDLKYLLYFEITDYIKSDKKLPSRVELLERKDWLYIRQWPFWQIKYFSGKKAETEILSRNLLGQTYDQYENIREIKGNVAFKGKVTGKVRLIRS